MKQKLILLDGMSGAGKTTLSKSLSKELPRTAIVGFDKIKRFISDFERGIQDNQIAREVTMVMAAKYLDLGLSVIVENPFKTEEEIDFYTTLAQDRKIHCYKFQLHANPDIALQRVVKRTQENNGDLTEERARNNISIFKNRSHLGFKVIDTTNMEPREVMDSVLMEIQD
ncbi:MAG: AAA family ATPase [Candidatus Paceibacterota bacterium]